MSVTLSHTLPYLDACITFDNDMFLNKPVDDVVRSLLTEPQTDTSTDNKGGRLGRAYTKARKVSDSKNPGPTFSKLLSRLRTSFDNIWENTNQTISLSLLTTELTTTSCNNFHATRLKNKSVNYNYYCVDIS